MQSMLIKEVFMIGVGKTICTSPNAPPPTAPPASILPHLYFINRPIYEAVILASYSAFVFKFLPPTPAGRRPHSSVHML